MPLTDRDQSILKHNKRRLQLIAVPFATAFMVVWWLGFTWLEHRFGVSRPVAQSATILFLFVLALPLEHILRFSDAMGQRHRSLFNDWQNQRISRLRMVFIIYLVFNIVLTLSALRHPHRGVSSDDPVNLTIVMLTCLVPWRLNLFLPRSIGPVDELLQSQLLQSATRGFATLVVLGLAAAIGNDARASTLHATLPAALLTSALVAHLSLWAQDRRAKWDADDR